jgi:hypothetical protein
MDSKEVIQARTARLVRCAEKMERGELSVTEMLAIIDQEEANADIPKMEFFDALRELVNKTAMLDSKEVIHARSGRLVDHMDDLAVGTISLSEMRAIIDKEEAAANISNMKFFDALRELAEKIHLEINP